MSYAEHLVTPAAVAAARDLQKHNPGLLAAAMRQAEQYAAQHRDADEVAALAAAIVAAFLPAHYRTGERTPESAAEALTAAKGAGKRAAGRAATALDRDNKRTASLEALAAVDPLAIAAARRSTEAPACLTLPRSGGASDPETAHWRKPSKTGDRSASTTASDVLAAVVTRVDDPAAQMALRGAIAAWLTDPNRDAHRSLVAALAHRTGTALGTAAYKRTQRRIALALKAVQEHEKAIRANPHDRDENGRWQPQETDKRRPWTADAVTLSDAAREAFRTRTAWTRSTYLGHRTTGPQPIGQVTRRTAPAGTGLGPIAGIPAARQQANRDRRQAMPNETDRLTGLAADRDRQAEQHDAWTPAPGDYAAHVTQWHRAEARRYRQAATVLRTVAAEAAAPLDPDALPDAGRYVTQESETTTTTRPITGWTDPSLTPVPTPLTAPAYIDPKTGRRYPYDWTHSSGQHGLASDVIHRHAGTVWLTDPATGTTTYGPVPADRWTPAAEAAARATLRPVEPEKRHKAEHDDTDQPAPRAGRYAAHGSMTDARRNAEKRAAAPNPGPVKKPSRRARNRTGSTGPTVPAYGITR